MTATKPVPKSLGILICDSVIDDRETGKKTLVGIFNTIGVIKLPCVHPELHVFVSLTDGYGAYKAKLSCVNLDSGDKVFEIQGDIKFEDPNTIVDLNFALKGLVFHQLGIHDFDFYCDAQPIVSRKFTVSQTKQG